MDIINAIILGAVQGVTEFLPVSSSAHLIIVSWLQNGAVLSITMNVAFHMGTLAAVLWFFRTDWIKLLSAGTAIIVPSRKTAENKNQIQLIYMLLIGSIPAGIIGILWKDEIEKIFHKPEMTLIPLAVVGILMWVFDRVNRSDKKVADLKLKDAFVIGIFQACALIPGTSRSGATIMGGRLFKLNRVDAARFSFLLGTPAMLGAAALEIRHFAEIDLTAAFISGILSSAIVGVFSIKFLLAFLSRFGFATFMIYRCVLAVSLYFFLNQ